MELVFDKDETIRELLGSYHLGRTKIHTIYMEKKVMINGSIASFDKVYNKGDVAIIDVTEENDIIPCDKNIDIVYEDEFLLIVNKEANLIIHGNEDSLINRVSNYFIKNNINTLPRFSNRIDEFTTGLVIFTKDFITAASMDNLVESKKVDKYYLAIVSGNPLKKGVIEKNIGRHRSKNRMIISKKGDYAKTSYEVIDGVYQKTLVLCKLETGRTHQIRVHFESIGHPLLGDELYGGDTSLINRQALHSYMLEFNHPITNKHLIIRCEMPEDMKKIVAEFKKIN